MNKASCIFCAPEVLHTLQILKKVKMQEAYTKYTMSDVCTGN